MQRKEKILQTWDQHIAWVIYNARGKSQQAQIFKMVYAECVYALWMERNQRIFENKYQNWETIAKEIAYICHVRVSMRVKTLCKVLFSKSSLDNGLYRPELMLVSFR